MTAGAQEAAVVDGQSSNGAREAIRDIAKKERPYLGADQANGAARYGNRIAARGESLPRAGRGLARDDPQPGRGDIQLFSGDLRQRGEDALADLDLAGRKPHAARFLEADPCAEQRIVQQALRQAAARTRVRRGHGSGSHLRAGARDRSHDPVVRAAAAEVAVEGGGNLAPARPRIAREQRRGGDQDARETVAALTGLFIEEGLLQW